MLSYIFLFLCCVRFNSAAAFPKYISTSAHINHIQNNLVESSFPLSELEVPSPTSPHMNQSQSELVQTIHSPAELEVLPPSSSLLETLIQVPSSDIKTDVLELDTNPDHFDKKEPPANNVESNKPWDLADVIEKIRSHRFSEAEIILRKNDFIDKIPEIVHNVYNSSESNIDLLLNFGRDLTESNLTSTVLFALWDEMKANGHRDVHKMTALVNAIELQLKNLNGPPEWKAEAEQLLTNETILDITSASVEILKQAMTSANSQNNSQVKLLADSIFKLDTNHKVFDEVIQKVANASFSEVSAAEIAQNLYNHAFLSQAITGLQELFKKLEDANNLNNPAVLNIAEYLKHLKDTPNYVNLSKTKKNAVDMMIQKMPKCARNIFFEPFVCIWNKGKAEYLYVAGSEFNRNEDKRSVFTRTTGEPVGPGVWNVEKSGDEFFFRNKAYENEYLFAATGMHNKDSRFVHTSTEGGKVGNKSSWKVELEGDVCYLRNVNYDEYLYASDRQSGDKSRYIFTWIPKTSTKEDNFQWQIRSCDMGPILKKGV